MHGARCLLQRSGLESKQPTSPDGNHSSSSGAGGSQCTQQHRRCCIIDFFFFFLSNRNHSNNTKKKKKKKKMVISQSLFKGLVLEQERVQDDLRAQQSHCFKPSQ